MNTNLKRELKKHCEKNCNMTKIPRFDDACSNYNCKFNFCGCSANCFLYLKIDVDGGCLPKDWEIEEENVIGFEDTDTCLADPVTFTGSPKPPINLVEPMPFMKKEFLSCKNVEKLRKYKERLIQEQLFNIDDDTKIQSDIPIRYTQK